jgi:hypothetical protein
MRVRQADLAVLARPDSQELSDRAEAHDHLIETATPFTVGRLQSPRRQCGLSGDPASSDAQMLSLNGRWFARRITSFGLVLWVEAAAQSIRGGMSGSPILLPDGGAVGVLCTGNQRDDDDADAQLDTGPGGIGGPNPLLFDQLPAWLARGAFKQGEASRRPIECRQARCDVDLSIQIANVHDGRPIEYRLQAKGLIVREG